MQELFRISLNKKRAGKASYSCPVEITAMRIKQR
jgi:stalled ribosome alternative rescue factor ArfA